ncbi:hypothetical protein G7054_g13902 [Neopestalotiopsis clavispora]|nr:hypothetical protein G7054_g13902 [Neopestalotiopsis clavispora]
MTARTTDPILDDTFVTILNAIDNATPMPLIAVREKVEKDLASLLDKAAQCLEESRGEGSRRSAVENFLILHGCFAVLQHWTSDILVNGTSPLLLLKDTASDPPSLGMLRAHFENVLQDIHDLQEALCEGHSLAHVEEARFQGLKKKLRDMGTFVAPLRELLESAETPEHRRAKMLVQNFLLGYNGDASTATELASTYKQTDIQATPVSDLGRQPDTVQSPPTTREAGFSSKEFKPTTTVQHRYERVSVLEKCLEKFGFRQDEYRISDKNRPGIQIELPSGQKLSDEQVKQIHASYLAAYQRRVYGEDDEDDEDGEDEEDEE